MATRSVPACLTVPLTGERLPSVRSLAEQLVVKPNILARAYRELERQRAVFSPGPPLAGPGQILGKIREWSASAAAWSVGQRPIC